VDKKPHDNGAMMMSKWISFFGSLVIEKKTISSIPDRQKYRETDGAYTTNKKS